MLIEIHVETTPKHVSSSADMESSIKNESATASHVQVCYVKSHWNLSSHKTFFRASFARPIVLVST